MSPPPLLEGHGVLLGICSRRIPHHLELESDLVVCRHLFLERHGSKVR